MTKKDAEGNVSKQYRFICPECHVSLKAKSAKAGSLTKCPKCEIEILVPITLVEEDIIYRDEKRKNDEDEPSRKDLILKEMKDEKENIKREKQKQKKLIREEKEKTKKEKQEKAMEELLKIAPPNSIYRNPELLKPDKFVKFAVWSIGVSFVGILLICVITAIFNSSGSSDDNKAGAWFAAQDFIKRRLSSPHTADFGDGLSLEFQDYNKCVTPVGNDEYIVTGWVDSQNGFGATIRTNFTLTMKDNGNDTWSLIGQPTMIQ